MRTLVVCSLAALAILAPEIARSSHSPVEDTRQSGAAVFQSCMSASPFDERAESCTGSIVLTNTGKNYVMAFNDGHMELRPMYPDCTNSVVISSDQVLEVVVTGTERWTYLFKRDAPVFAEWLANGGPENCVD